MLHRHEELQGIYLRLGYNENKKAVSEEAAGLQKKVNDVIEKGIKDIWEEKNTCKCN